MPDEGSALCCAAPLVPPPAAGAAVDGAAGAADGAVCCAAAPPDSRPPVACALARPVPAISATAATDIINRLVIIKSPRTLALPAPTTKGEQTRSGGFPVPSG